jgi:hypothetical protein
LEWNEGIRVVAFFGEKEPALVLGRDMPQLFTREHVILRTPEVTTSYRTEVPISPAMIECSRSVTDSGGEWGRAAALEALSVNVRDR